MTTSEKIFNFIKEYIGVRGYSPSQQEIGDAVGLLSKSTTSGHLQRLEDKGLIKRNGVRAIEIVGQEPEVKVINEYKGVPTTIKWQGRIYHHDPIMDTGVR